MLGSDSALPPVALSEEKLQALHESHLNRLVSHTIPVDGCPSAFSLLHLLFVSSFIDIPE